jgi:hypothetical protein
MPMSAADRTTNEKAKSLKAKLWLRWLLLWPIMVGLVLYPVSNAILRATSIVIGFLLVIGILFFYWRYRWLRFSTLSIVGIIAIFLTLPGRPAQPTHLRQRYLNALESYAGTRYVWGGEGRFGIDCSGLVRVGLINALLAQGFATLDPEAARQAIRLWWYDCSAKALGEEYHNFTGHLIDSDALNQLDYEHIQPGDIAVTADGLHVLAYLGDQVWIQAEPNLKQVIKFQSPSTNEWFQTPVRLMRWQALNSTSKSNISTMIVP